MPFKVTSQMSNQGLDVSGRIPWQMVPLKGLKNLRVSGTSGLTPRVRDPKKLKITLAGSTLKLHGLAEGLTYVDWMSPGCAAPRPGFTLEVSVKKKKSIRTAFHYVDDGRQQKTVRQSKNITALLTATNNILTAQTNAAIISKSAKVLKIKKNLGAVVRFSSHLKGVPKKEHEWDDLKKHRDLTADLNVFFVLDFEVDKTPLVNNAGGGTIISQKMCIVEDHSSLSRSAIALAHETVHALGQSTHIKKTGLMDTTGSSPNIGKNVANLVNPSGAK